MNQSKNTLQALLVTSTLLAFLILASISTFGVSRASSINSTVPPLPEVTPNPVGPVSPLPGGGQASSGGAFQFTSTNDKVLVVHTIQWGIGWWDVLGALHVEQQTAGKVIIPAEAITVSIPSDLQGIVAPQGWTKTQRPDGEWVIVRN